MTALSAILELAVGLGVFGAFLLIWADLIRTVRHR